MSAWVTFSSPIGQYCEALSVSMSQSSPSTAGGARRIAQVNDIYLSKKQDSLSSLLFLSCIKGTIFDEVLIEFFKPNNALYLTYTLSGVVISSFQTPARGDIESMSLNAQTMSVKYG